MALQHELRSACAGVPKLYSTVLRAGKHPVGIRSKSHRQDKVPVTLECLDTLATLRAGLVALSRSAELPHLDRPVKTAGNKIFTAWGERNGVDTVLVAVRTFKALNKETGVDIPNTHALVKRAGGDKLGVGRNSNGRHSVLYGERKRISTLLNIPQADCPIAAARGDGATVTCKVQ